MASKIFALFLSGAAAAAAQNAAWVFRQSVNGGALEVGKHAVHEAVPMPSTPGVGEVQIKLSHTSVIPSYRGRMDLENWPAKAVDYSPFDLNKPFVVEIVGEVVASQSEAFSVGDRLTGFYPHMLYQNIKADGSDSLFSIPPVKLDPAVPAEKVLSVMSIAGGLTSVYITDYSDVGSIDCSKEKKTVIITSAASTVGMIAGQLYKAKGCRVIGSTSTRAKADRVMALGGFDEIIAYKEEDFVTRLNELAPDGVDLDLENVGGTQLDAILSNMKNYGKVVLCGLVSDYDKPADQVHGTKTLFEAILKRLTLKGILVLDIMPNINEAVTKLSTMLANGTLRTEETTIYGYDRWGEAMKLMLDSYNFGRLVVASDAQKKEL